MNTKEMIAVMQAYDEGGTIQMRFADYKSDWGPCPIPIWNWSDFEYRVQPAPRYLNVYAGHPVATSWKPSLEEAERVRHSLCIGYLEDKQDGTDPVFHPLKS